MPVLSLPHRFRLVGQPRPNAWSGNPKIRKAAGRPTGRPQTAPGRARQKNLFRLEEERIPIASRYLLTVRRAILRPNSFDRISAI